MTIRGGQIDRFKKNAEEQFAPEIAEHLEKEHPQAIAGMDREVVLSRVSRELRRGQGYGFERKLDLLTFVVLAFVIGPQFDVQPTVAGVLNDPGIPPERKFDFLFANTPREEWDLMATHSGGSAPWDERSR